MTDPTTNVHAPAVADVVVRRQLLAAEELTPMDLLRARTKLGVDGYRYIDDDVKGVSREERTVFLLWCFESRTDPAFTLEQAQRMTFRQIVDRYMLEGETDDTEPEVEAGSGEVEAGPPSPPARTTSRTTTRSRGKRSAGGNARSAATSSTSPAPSTTS